MKLSPVTSNFSLKDHVYRTLREAITGMDIYAEDADLRLDERSLAEQLGISRTPLREAISRLERDGLVSVAPRKGIFVQRKSMDEVLEMIIAWAALESMAARLACTAASDQEISDLRRLARQYSETEAGIRIAEYSENNIRFHQRILEMSGCALLGQMAEGLFLHMHAVRLRAMGEGNRVKRSVVDHEEIVVAIESRNPDAAERRVREHTLQLHDHVRRTWANLERHAAQSG